MTLDRLRDLFLRPPREFSPTPAWWWSGERVELPRLKWQLDRLHEGGVYNVVVINLVPAWDSPAYFSEEWWALVAGVCEHASKRGMRIWFHDQVGFAVSVVQNDLVVENPSFSGQWLDFATVSGEGLLQLTCPPQAEPLGGMATPIDADGAPCAAPIPLVAGRQLTYHASTPHRLQLVFAVRRGFDLLGAEAAGRLIDGVYGEYERRVGKEFGTVVAGFFQDELAALPTWGDGFAEQFRQRNGYELLDCLPALWEGEDEQSQRVRCDYHRLRAALAEEAFFRPLFEWHEQHGLLCGFDQMVRDGGPVHSARFYADYMRTQRWYSAPGTEHGGELKVNSSLAHLYGRPRVWIEAFHSTGWGGTLEETLDWLLLCLLAGATLYNPHAVYYTSKGGWWDFAPPSTCWRQPYWRHYRVFADAISRLSWILSEGEHLCELAVLHPMATGQASSPAWVEPSIGGPAVPPGPMTVAEPACQAVWSELVGSTSWRSPRSGVLQADRRDFDVLDEESLRRGDPCDGALRVGGESYRAVVLPACTVLEPGSAAALCRFVEAGGLLVAVGELPVWTVGQTDDPELARLRSLFQSGAATYIPRAEELKQALAALPRSVEASVPVLHRRIEGRDVVLVPASYPRATVVEQGASSRYEQEQDFDASRYAPSVRVLVRGAQGAPELWDPLSGESRPLEAEQTDEGVELTVELDGAPLALLVWPLGPPSESQPRPPRLSQTVCELAGPWTSRLEPTLDNSFGDFRRPAAGWLPLPETWSFDHRTESGEDGVTAGWHRSEALTGWGRARATFGPYGWWTGPVEPESLPPPLSVQDKLTPVPAEWQPATYSLTRGIDRDPLHRQTLGVMGRVPESFLHFGAVEIGQAVQFRTTFTAKRSGQAWLAIGAAAAKQAWLNGKSLGEGPPGHLWAVPVEIDRGRNLLELRLLVDEPPFAMWAEPTLRASWCLVGDPASVATPEWLALEDPLPRGSSATFSTVVELPQAADTHLRLTTSVPLNLSVDGAAVGRLGTRAPTYSSRGAFLLPLAAGSHEIAVELEGTGQLPAVLLEAEIASADGRTTVLRSGRGWEARRDGSRVPLRIRRSASWWSIETGLTSQRAHPLRKAIQLDSLPPPDSVWDVLPDAYPELRRVEWFRWRLPPGATRLQLDTAGEARLWIDGEEALLERGSAELPRPAGRDRLAALRVVAPPGRYQGAVFDGPVSYTVGEGGIELGDWGAQGLEAYSGGVRYRCSFDLPSLPQGVAAVDLGRVRGTAEVWLNGTRLGVRIGSPYRFDTAAALREGENALEVLVCNTLAPFMSETTPSPSAAPSPGQNVSGLFGPVQILATAEPRLSLL